MRADDDPLQPLHWLAELGDGLGDPLLRSLWNSPAPEPVANAPANANLTVRWQHNQPPRVCGAADCAAHGAGLIPCCRWPS